MAVFCPDPSSRSSLTETRDACWVGWLHLYVHRPLATSDLAFAVLAILGCWLLWGTIRDSWWLLADRIAPASEALISWKEAPAQLESFRTGEERVIGLLRHQG